MVDGYRLLSFFPLYRVNQKSNQKNYLTFLLVLCYNVYKVVIYMSKKELISKLKELRQRFDVVLSWCSSCLDNVTFNELLSIDKEIYNIQKLLENDLSSNED